jgi:fibronectin type 3 domain-containing protein
MLGIAFLLSAYSAGAEDFSDEIEKAVVLYERGDFSKAILKLKQVIGELRDREEDELRNEGLFKANLYLGMSYLGQGKESLARDSFKTAIRFVPHQTLDAELFPPKVISLYNEVLARSLSSLSVQSNVTDAEVFIDSIRKGNTPLVIRTLQPGTHTVKVVVTGQEIVKTVSLEPGRDMSITADFQNTGSLHVTSEPAAATVSLNGNAAGTTPLILKNVPSGEHVLSVSKEGHSESKMQVMVKTNENTDAHFKLVPITYSIRISSAPEHAKVLLDEIAKGFTPVLVENVTAGTHKIRIVKEGYEELGDTLDVKTPLTERTYPLTPHTGNLSIRSEPSGVEVIIDGRNAGLTPLRVGGLPVKQYAVQLKKEGYREKTVTITLAKDKTSEISETLFEFDSQPPHLTFHPVATAVKENKNLIRTTVSDNQSVGEVSLMLKMAGETDFQRVKMSNPIKGMYEAVIPDLYMKKGATVEYYLLACDVQDNCTTAGSKNSPYKLKVISMDPYTEGFVLDFRWEGDTPKVIISLGSEEGVKKGDTFVVFRVGKELRDPKTGDLLQIEQIFVGTLKVRDLMPHTAYATIDSAVITIAKNDRIRKVASAPSGVVTEGTYATKIFLRWAPNHEPEVQGYRIFRSSTADGNYQEIGQIDGRDNTFYEDTRGMREGLTFSYKITAFNILGAESPMSEPVAGKTKKVGAPPETMKAEGMKVREVHLRWDAVEQDPDMKSYVIYRADSEGGQFSEIAQVERDTGTYRDTENLKDGKTYFYRIAQKSRHGAVGELSSPIKAKTKDAPAPPQKINAVSGMARMVRVQWDRHSDTDVAGYIVYRNGKESAPSAKTGKTQNTEFLDRGLSDGMKYSYAVSSYYYVGGTEIIGPPSQPVSAETKYRPKAPAHVSADSGLARKIHLKWNPNEEKDIKEYLVYRGAGDKIDRDPFSKVTTHAFTDTNLTDNAAYSYAVKAVDIDGLESDLSTVVSAVTKSLPKPPMELKGHSSQGRIYLTWRPNEEKDIQGYHVYKKGWLKSTPLTASNQNSCEIIPEEKKGSMKLYVTAIDKDGLESGPSEEITILIQ